MATAKLAKRVWGLATSSTGESLAAVTAGRCELPGISSHLCSNQSSPGAQWGCPPSYTATLLAFEGVSLGLWWAQQLQLKGTIHLFHSTGASAGVGDHWAFPAIAAPYPTGQGPREHLASCWVHPDGALGNWGCNGWACGPFWAYWSELGQIHLSLDLQKSLLSWGTLGLLESFQFTLTSLPSSYLRTPQDPLSRNWKIKSVITYSDLMPGVYMLLDLFQRNLFFQYVCPQTELAQFWKLRDQDFPVASVYSPYL